jgi:UDP-GlcNAc:undecaprenyl-phosphate GlcNAc-1-phosphate transferase
VIYSGVILVIYSIEISGAIGRPLWQAALQYFFVILAVVIAVGVRFSERRHFAVTPSDYLVAFILLAAANLPVFGDVNYAKLAIQSAVVLYGAEFVLRRQSAAGRAISIAAVAAFVIAGIKAF